MSETYQALYRQWRPQTFDEVVGQEPIVTALRQAIINDEIAHAYLFSGTRGTGKTSLAKIFARAVNCLHPENGNPCNECEICQGILDRSLLDVIEMDAASNNSVEDVRRIIDEVAYLPSQARYKVYIIDEVHMLSTAAFNALLKTLEEPPAHAIFILATTEPQRLPATILSRCQRYDFRRIPLPDLKKRLRKIATSIDLKITDEAIELIAVLADGALRDAISLLDQSRVSVVDENTPLERQDILQMTGRVNDAFMLKFLEALIHQYTLAILEGIDEISKSGQDYSNFVSELSEVFRNLMLLKAAGPKAKPLLPIPDDILKRYAGVAGHLSLHTLHDCLKRLSDLLQQMRWSPDPRLALETTCLTLDLGPLPEEQKSSADQPKPENRQANEKVTDTTMQAKAKVPLQTSQNPASSTKPKAAPLATSAKATPRETSTASQATMRDAQQDKPAKVPTQAANTSKAKPTPSILDSIAVEVETMDEDDADFPLVPEPPLDEPLMPEPELDVEAEIKTEAETKKVAKEETEPQPTVAAKSKTAPQAESTPSAAQEPSQMTKTDTSYTSGSGTKVPAQELEARFDEFLETVDQLTADPNDPSLLQFTLRHFKRSFDDGLITIYFAPEHNSLYNDLTTAQMEHRLERACQMIYKDREAKVQFVLESDGKPPRPAKINREPSAWIAEAKKLLEEYGIPLVEETLDG